MCAGPPRAHRGPRSGLRGPSSHRAATRQARGPQAQPWWPLRRTLLSCGDDGGVGSTPCGLHLPCARARGLPPAQRRDTAGRAWTWNEPGALWAQTTQQTGATLPPSPRTGPCGTAAPARVPGAPPGPAPAAPADTPRPTLVPSIVGLSSSKPWASSGSCPPAVLQTAPGLGQHPRGRS